MSEKRAAERLQKILYADIRGKHSAFRGMVTNISRTGALLTITDQRFESLTSHGDLSLAGLLIASHFGDGLLIELLEKPLKLEADVVRVFDESNGERQVLWLGCHFRHELSEDECVAVGLKQGAMDAMFAAQPEPARPPPPPPPAAPSTPDKPDVDPRIRVGTFDDVKPQGSINAIRGRDAEPRATAPVSTPGKARVFRSGPALGMRELLQAAAERGATDLHVKGLSPVRARIGGTLQDMGDRPLEPEEAEKLVRELLSPAQWTEFDETGDVSFSTVLDGGARFRVNAYRARKIAGLAARRIADKVPTIEGLGLAAAVGTLAVRPKGLVLVTGLPGSGRSSTLAAMVQHLNQSRACHIVTIEDPIEFLHKESKAQITQREIEDDTPDFPSAFARAMRQDADVVVVDELRDLETIRLAVAAAEAGHLVLAAVPGGSAVNAAERIADLFPVEQQRQARAQIAESLLGVIGQLLLPKIGGGSVVAQEILVVTAPVRALLRDAKAAPLWNAMQNGSKDGMQTLEDSLNDLVARGQVTYETALARAPQPKLIEREGKRIGWSAV